MVSINQFRRFVAVATVALGLSALLTACGAGDEGEIGVET
jgi:hypothetical protein